ITACVLDTLLQHSNLVLPDCEDEWENAITCSTGIDYGALGCTDLFLEELTASAARPCDAENQALRSCLAADDSVLGTRGACQYEDDPNGPGSCFAECWVGGNHFTADYDG